MAEKRPASSRQMFPRWANWVVPVALVLLAAGLPYMVVLVGYGAAPETINANYAPKQPVPYSHALHAGQLNLDCRYCHTTVEDASFAALPPTEVCMNCHGRTRMEKKGQQVVGPGIRWDSEKLAPLKRSYATGKPVEWVKVHDLPDYVFFNHSAHVNNGVSCYECHGRIDQMKRVRQVAPLSMGWCLECHRNPTKHLVPKDRVTDLGWVASLSEKQRKKIGKKMKKKYKIDTSGNRLSDCSLCHR